MALYRLLEGSDTFGDALRWDFSRAAETREPTGARVPYNTPRFGRSVAVPGLLGPEVRVAEDFAATSVILNAGLDRDQQTHVVAMYDPLRKSVRVYRGQASLTLHYERFCTTDAGLSGGDILREAVGGCPVGTKAFEPGNAVIVHGTIVLLCRVRRKVTPSTWQLEGIGLCYSTDLGQTWTRYWDDTDDPRDIGHLRLSGWEMSNYYCPFHTPGSPLTEVVVPFTDYRLAGGTAPAQGGRACWFKMTRASEADAFVPLWSAAPGSTPRVAVYSYDTSPADGGYVHLHSCGITEYMPQDGPQGWQIVIGVGDGLASSMVRVIVTDIAHYWEARDGQGVPKWKVKVNWQGTADSAVMNPTLNDGFGGPGPGGTRRGDDNSGNQFVGVGPGPDPGTLIVGCDAQGEGIWVLEPGHSPTSKAFLNTAVSDHGTINRANCFYVRVTRPELAVRTVACDMIKSYYRSGLVAPRSLDGLWISYDNGRPGTWGWVGLEGYNQRYGLVGSSLYLMSQAGTVLFRRELSGMMVGRPLLIGPGGNQWLRDDATRLYVNGTQVQRCPRDSQGNWLIPTADGTATLGAIHPQPPTCVDTVWRVMKRLEDSGGRIAYVVPSATSPSTVSHFRKGGLTDPGSKRVMRTRWWMLNFSGRAPDSPLEAAGRSPCNAFTRYYLDSGPNSSGQLGAGGTISNDRWEAATRVFNLDIAQGERFGFSVNSSDLPGDGDFFLAWSEFLEGYGSFGYPLPPDPCDCPQQQGGGLWTDVPEGPTAWPHEKATLRGLSLQGDWTVLAAGVMPDDSWDQFIEHDPSDEPYRLLSVTNADASAYITIAAAPLQGPNRSSTVDVLWKGSPTAGNGRAKSGPAIFLRGRPFLFALVNRSSGVTLHTSCGGLDVTPAVGSTTSTYPTRFTEIRLGGHDFQRVDAFQWVGVTPYAGAMTAAQVRIQFATLGFLQ